MQQMHVSCRLPTNCCRGRCAIISNFALDGDPATIVEGYYRIVMSEAQTGASGRGSPPARQGRHHSRRLAGRRRKIASALTTWIITSFQTTALRRAWSRSHDARNVSRLQATPRCALR
jgi:hypothetical protein